MTPPQRERLEPDKLSALWRACGSTDTTPLAELIEGPRPASQRPRAWERAHEFDNVGMGIINVSELSASDTHVSNMAQGSLPAFLLYTSGSTGTPKGISLSQAGFMNYAAAKARKLLLGKEVVLQQSSTGFDMSIAQTFNALANGGALIMVPQSSRGDPLAISKLMLKEKVTFTIGTPSEYLMIVRYGRDILQKCSSWRHACLGGEAISERLKEEFRQLGHPDLILTDCYGPTEISAATTCETVSMTSKEDGGIDEFLSVGKPIANSSIYILDKVGKPVPNGFPGEICVSGAGVALGYLDLPELNMSKFVEDPFALPEDAAKGWSRMYRTGDKGRLLEDGSLIFMGRLDGDTQIKLRGLRIEMDEVANTLLRMAQGSLSDAIVSVRGDPEFLVAHVVFAPGKSMSDCDLRQLARSLPFPQYMCPSMLIPLERLPITQNGKVDRRAIQALPCSTQRPELQPRTTECLTLSEGELRLLWREVLHQTTSSVDLRSDSDFFMAGGSSLLLVKLQNSISEKIGVTLSLSELYQASTLARMAARINIEKAHQSERAIDWDVETAVPEDLISISSKEEPVQNTRVHNHGREILLTGSTTFLGSAILRSLLSDSSVRKIHCIAVPPDSQQQLPESDKITPYLGSLLDPSLGLSQAQSAHIQSHIDQIIHAGSLGHCLNTYFSLRTPNYLSTRFLADLAVPRRIPFHLLSSNRVVLLAGHTSLPPVSVAAHPPPTNGSEGFTATKWASEHFLETLARKTGLPVTVHRACAVIGDSAPSEDAQNALLRYSVLLRAVPRFEHMAGYFDFKDVDLVAADIAAATMTTPQDARDSVTFRHHSSGVKVPVAAFRRRMEQLYGGEFAELDQSEWLKRATERGIEPLIVSYLQAIGQRNQTVSFPFLGEIG